MQTIKLSLEEFKQKFPDKYIDNYRVIGFFVVDDIEYEVPIADYDQKVIDKIIDEAEEKPTNDEIKETINEETIEKSEYVKIANKRLKEPLIHKWI